MFVRWHFFSEMPQKARKGSCFETEYQVRSHIDVYLKGTKDQWGRSTSAQQRIVQMALFLWGRSILLLVNQTPMDVVFSTVLVINTQGETGSPTCLTMGHRGDCGISAFTFVHLNSHAPNPQKIFTISPRLFCNFDRSTSCVISIGQKKSNKPPGWHTCLHPLETFLIRTGGCYQKDSELSAPPWDKQSRVNRTRTASDSISCSEQWELLWRGCYGYTDWDSSGRVKAGVCCRDKWATEERLAL